MERGDGMGPAKTSEYFIQNLLYVLPNWHSKLVRPFKDTLSSQMSLETYYCLETLKASGTVTMTELSGLLRVTKQQVTKLVDRLCECGFVERVFHEGDRRAVWIQTTPKAHAYLEEYYLKNPAFLRSLEAQLSEEELTQLNRAVEILGELLPKLK